MDDPVLVYSTFPTKDAAEAAGTLVVAEKLAACVNILSGMSSIYRWQGSIERAEEVVLLAKTRGSVAGRLVGALRKSHPYEVPDIVVLPIIAGDPAYLAWIAAETEQDLEA